MSPPSGFTGTMPISCIMLNYDYHHDLNFLHFVIQMISPWLPFTTQKWHSITVKYVFHFLLWKICSEYCASMQVLSIEKAIIKGSRIINHLHSQKWGKYSFIDYFPKPLNKIYVSKYSWILQLLSPRSFTLLFWSQVHWSHCWFVGSPSFLWMYDSGYHKNEHIL